MLGFILGLIYAAAWLAFSKSRYPRAFRWLPSSLEAMFFFLMGFITGICIEAAIRYA